MELKDIMNLKKFVVVGNTLSPDKYAYKIKNELIKYHYQVECVYKEKPTIDDVSFDKIDCLDLCINPFTGLRLLKKCHKAIKVVLIQPGAEGDEIKKFLQTNGIDYLEGCALLGLSMYKKNKK